MVSDRSCDIVQIMVLDQVLSVTMPYHSNMMIKGIDPRVPTAHHTPVCIHLGGNINRRRSKIV